MVWLVLVLIWKVVVVNDLLSRFWLLNWVVVEMCCSSWVSCWILEFRDWWLLVLLEVLVDLIVRVWICCRMVVEVERVFLVVCDSEILLLVLWVVWFRLLICEVKWLVIDRLVVLFLVLLMCRLVDRCWIVVCMEFWVLLRLCCVLSDVMLVLMICVMVVFLLDIIVVKNDWYLVWF